MAMNFEVVSDAFAKGRLVYLADGKPYKVVQATVGGHYPKGEVVVLPWDYRRTVTLDDLYEYGELPVKETK